MQNLFEDEIALKKMLDEFGVRYGDKMNKWRFVVAFEDNKGNFSDISCSVYSSPIVALRDYSTILKNTKLPADDVSIHLILAFSEDKTEKFNDCYLSPYLYYKKPDEVNATEKIEESKE